MNLIDQKVSHKVFGAGKVTSHENNIVEVSFADENKKFVYPDAFEKFLTIQHKATASIVGEVVEIQTKQREEEVVYKEEQRILEREQQQLKLDYERLTNNHKLHEESQMVFWCTPEELEKSLSKWTVFTGLVKTGVKKDKPNNANRLHRNSAVLLTKRSDNELEEKRSVYGVYMVDERFVGKLCKNGIIPAHKLYKLSITEEESEKLPFWNYYSNKKTPYKIAWNTGKYRYFDNHWMAQMLRDIVEVKQDAEEKQLAQQFFEYFCQMNQINIRSLGAPTGTLLAEQA